jgi:hypothetical protein
LHAGRGSRPSLPRAIDFALAQLDRADEILCGDTEGARERVDREKTLSVMARRSTIFASARRERRRCLRSVAIVSPTVSDSNAVDSCVSSRITSALISPTISETEIISADARRESTTSAGFARPFSIRLIICGSTSAVAASCSREMPRRSRTKRRFAARC